MTSLTDNVVDEKPVETKHSKPLVENTKVLYTLRIALALAVLLIWEWGARIGFVDPFYFSMPSEVGAKMAEWFGTGMIWDHIIATLNATALGLLVGGTLGVIVGFILARSEIISAIILPYIQIGNALPRVVLAPVFMLWFGIGIWSKVAVAVSLVFFIVFFNTYRGVREVDAVTINNVRMLGANERQLTTHVLIPSALVWIFSSLHLSLGFSIIGVVVGEFVGASKGVGYLIRQQQSVFNTDGVFAGIAVLIVLVLAIEMCVTLAERRVLSWKP